MLLDTRFTPEYLAGHPADQALASMFAARTPVAKTEQQLRGEREQLLARQGHDVMDRLPNITCPTLVAAGRYDGVAPLANSEAIVGLIADSELRVYEGGHIFLVQDPRRYRRCSTSSRGRSGPHDRAGRCGGRLPGYPWWFGWRSAVPLARGQETVEGEPTCSFDGGRSRRYRSRRYRRPIEFDPGGDGLVNVRDLLGRYSIEELSESAENYFARLTSWDSALAKPFYSLYDAPDLMVDVGALLSGLELVHGLSVLDFGAGTGWLSWMLTQLGCRAVLTDVSGTALKIATERYRRWPIIGAWSRTGVLALRWPQDRPR